MWHSQQLEPGVLFQDIMLLEVFLVLGTLLIYFLFSKKDEETLPFKDGWWGRGQKPVTKEDSSIRPFKVETAEEELSDLFRRLDQARFTEPLENSFFHYGTNSVHLRKVVSYWKNQFNWKKQVEVLNNYPQFKTKIQDFNSVSAASVFYELMLRLGFSEFYTQGGDCGWLICTNLAQIAPSHVKGLHLNMVLVTKLGLSHLLSILLGRYFPGLFGFQDEDVRRMFPFLKKWLHKILSEFGYAHIQTTKPDTVGCGLNDSPVGLAAYILEKFSSWTDMEFQNLEDGGLERKFSLDDLLTNIMIYWVSGCIVSSMRFYKENLQKGIGTQKHDKLTVQVPTGIAAFPNEILHIPQAWAKKKYTNIVSFHFMPRGGHFAAFEEPELLAKDILQFVDKVEKEQLWKKKGE
nr:epoxide hydrolase 1 isoform X3 [Taeniopygia guttata]